MRASHDLSRVTTTFDESNLVPNAGLLPAAVLAQRLDGDVLELEADHRRHAIVEQSIAALKSAGLAHLPSGNFMANAAWLALTVMSHNLGRAVGHLAGPDLHTATAATLRRKVFTMPGRLVHSGRRRRLRLPESWPWAVAITTALNTITAIPMRC